MIPTTSAMKKLRGESFPRSSPPLLQVDNAGHREMDSLLSAAKTNGGSHG